ncbi:MAG: ABC transporter permease subunit, partial [Candidatus Aminicenantales bacterium]
MFKTLFARELLDGLVSRRFIVVLLLCLIIFPLGSYISRLDYQARLENYRESVRLYESSRKTVEDVLYKGGARGFRPPSRYSFLSTGLELVLPDMAETMAKFAATRTDMRLSNTQGLDNLYEFFHGPLDWSFIVAVVMTFLALAFTYNAVSGEKENGTLGLILANSVPRSRLILAKASANFLMLAIPFLAGLLLSFLVAPSSPDAGPFGPPVVSAAVFSLLIIAAFFNLGLLVSSLTRQAVSSIIVLLLAWTMLFAVYPRLSVILAQIVRPVPSEQSLAEEKTRIRLENEKACEAEVDKLIKEYPVPRGQMPPKEFEERQEAIRARYQGLLVERLQKADDAYEKKCESQILLSLNLARLSPVSCFVRPMAEIAGTGWLEYRRFKDAVSRFQTALNGEIYGKNTYTRMAGGVGMGFSGKMDAPPPRLADTRVRFAAVAGN